MEVSSQALKYDRVDGIIYDAGVFLNIGTDHISDIEHPDFDDYLCSKLRIFEHCKKACYNLDCDEQDNISKAAAACPYIITFSSKDENANVYAYGVHSDSGKVTFRAKITVPYLDGLRNIDEVFTLGSFGMINLENALAAISLSLLIDIPIEYIKSGLAKASAPGRMEVFYGKDNNRIAIVDYAHNKLSYEKLFETIKSEFPHKKLIIVFGCPGNKAYARREELGTIAGLNADYSIITEDDCGEEDVYDICNEISAHLDRVGGRYEILVDRVEAIKKAISLMDDNSILIVPGKGRETRLKRGTQYVDSPSDADVVMKYL